MIDDDDNYIKKYSKRLMIIIDDNNYIKKYSKTSMIIIDDNNYIKNYSKGLVRILRLKLSKKDRWEYLDQKYSKGLLGIFR